MMSDTNAEEKVIGAILVSTFDEFDVADSSVAEVLALLRPSDFSDSENASVWSAIEQVVDDGDPIDDTTVAAKLGGYTILGKFSDRNEAARRVTSWAEMVKRYSVARLACARCLAAAASIEACSGSPVAVAEAVASIAEVEVGASGKRQNFSGKMKEVLANVQARADGKQKPLSTGFGSLDQVLAGGLRPKDLWVIGGIPGTGKSVLAINMFRRMATMSKGSVWFASLEMSDLSLIERMLAEYGDLEAMLLKHGKMSSLQWQQVTGAVSSLDGRKIDIVTYSGATAQDIRAGALRHKAYAGSLDCVFVDYLQRLKSPGRSTYEQATYAVKALKSIAIELNVPVVALAQLNRSYASRGDKRPMMSDLRDSGQIEQEADIITLLHREEGAGSMECDFQKQRDGVNGVVKLQWIPAKVRFDDERAGGY